MASLGVVAAVATTGAIASECSADTLYTHTDLAAPASAVQFVRLTDPSLHRPPLVMFSWGRRDLPAGAADQQTTLDPTDPFSSYFILGLDAAGGVLLSFSDNSSVLGQPFSSIFPSFSEPAVADAILTGGSLLDSFVAVAASDPRVATSVGGQVVAQVIDFSDGAGYGTMIASFAPIPAPGAASVLVIALPWTMRRRRAAASS
jgi:hypothetical protein